MFEEVGKIFQTIPLSLWMTGGVSALIAYLAALAFANGAIKQLLGMVCMASGVAAAWYVFSSRSEVFGSAATGMNNDRLLMFSGGAGVLAYAASRMVLGLLSMVGVLRILGAFTGWKGALLSTIPSAFMLWSASMALRVVGNAYGVETASKMAQEGAKIQSYFGSAVNQARSAMDRSVLGSIAAKVDPFGMRSTANLAKLLLVWPDQKLWGQMMENGKVKEIFCHQRMLELGNDTTVRSAIEKKDFAGLIQLPQVTKAASHQDLEPLLTDASVEETMDRVVYARPMVAKK
jgi:hypothetical protein